MPSGMAILFFALVSTTFALPQIVPSSPAEIIKRNDKDTVASISALMNSPTFVPYAKPNQKVEEWIALGDSYTAGTGCNGLDEIVGGGDALRGKRSYPMQMSTDKDGWEFINGNDVLPRFSFSAYTGDTTVLLVSEQLKAGPFGDTNKDLPRHPFGKPQLATVTIGGNDAGLSDIVDACIYQAWPSKTCDEALTDLDNALKDGSLQDKISVALYNIAQFGRDQGGADPRQSFQVFVTSYTTFWNDKNPECDNISWGFWFWRKPKLTQDLRKRLNDLTRRTNDAVKAAAQDLKPFGVIYTDGLETTYETHRYCEPGHTNGEMVDYDTWFWSASAHMNTPSEGPGDPNEPYNAAEALPDMQQIMIDFLYPDKGFTASSFSEQSPPEADTALKAKYPTFDAILDDMAASDNATIQAVPFNYKRSFHPKGTAYGHHKDLFMGAIADNREAAANANPTTTTANGPTSTPTLCEGNQVQGNCQAATLPSAAPFSGPQAPACAKADGSPGSQARINEKKLADAAAEYCNNLVNGKTVLGADGGNPKPGTVPGAAENGKTMVLTTMYYQESCPEDKSSSKLDFAAYGLNKCVDAFSTVIAQVCSQDPTWTDYNKDFTVQGGVWGTDCGLFSVSTQ